MAVRKLQKAAVIEGQKAKLKPVEVKAARVTMKATPKFVLLYQPRSWDVFEDIGEILPVLKKLPDEPGYFGVLSGSIMAKRSEIETLLHGTFLPESEVGVYNIAYPGSTGTVWLAPWERVRNGSTAQAPDIKVYADFCHALMDAGTVQLPSLEEVQIRREALQKDLDVATEKKRTQSIRSLTAKLAVIDKLLAESEAEAE